MQNSPKARKVIGWLFIIIGSGIALLAMMALWFAFSKSNSSMLAFDLGQLAFGALFIFVGRAFHQSK